MRQFQETKKAASDNLCNIDMFGSRTWTRTYDLRIENVNVKMEEIQ